jgi:hypothetical protein
MKPVERRRVGTANMQETRRQKVVRFAKEKELRT